MSDAKRALELAAEIERHDGRMTGHGISCGPGWRAGTHDKVRLFFPDPNGLAGPMTESCLLRANDHFKNYGADLAGIAYLRNAAPEVAAVLRGLVAEVARLKHSDAFSDAADDHKSRVILDLVAEVTRLRADLKLADDVNKLRTDENAQLQHTIGNAQTEVVAFQYACLADHKADPSTVTPEDVRRLREECEAMRDVVTEAERFRDRRYGPEVRWDSNPVIIREAGIVRSVDALRAKRGGK